MPKTSRLWQYQCLKDGTFFYYQWDSGSGNPPAAHIVECCPVCRSKKIKLTRSFPPVDEHDDALLVDGRADHAEVYLPNGMLRAESYGEAVRMVRERFPDVNRIRRFAGGGLYYDDFKTPSGDLVAQVVTRQVPPKIQGFHYD